MKTTIIATEREMSTMERFARRINENLNENFFVRAMMCFATGLVFALPYLFVALIEAIVIPHHIGLPLWPAFAIIGVVFAISVVVLNGSYIMYNFYEKKYPTAEDSDVE